MIRQRLFAFLGLTQFLELGKRLVGSVSALFFRCVNYLVEVTAVENGDAVRNAGVVPVEVPGIEPHADQITLFLPRQSDERVGDGGTAYVGRIIKRVGQCDQDLVLVVGRKDIRILFRLLFI